MDLVDEALVLTVRPHGEHGAIVRFLAFGEGLRAGFVQGARSTRRRPLLQPGNQVQLRLRARTSEQLPQATVELLHSRALAMFDVHAAAILSYGTALTAGTLAEAVPHPRLAVALDALLAGLAAGMGQLPALAALARYELLLLEETGFGLDFSACALGGDAGDLAFVSPKSGRAISRERASGQPWAARLLPLPAFLHRGGEADAAAVAAALDLSGHFLRRHFPGDALSRLRAAALGRMGAGLGSPGAAP